MHIRNQQRQEKRAWGGLEGLAGAYVRDTRTMLSGCVSGSLDVRVGDGYYCFDRLPKLDYSPTKRGCRNPDDHSDADVLLAPSLTAFFAE